MCLDEKIKEVTLREIARMSQVFSSLEIREPCRLLELAIAYYNDSKYFLEKNLIVEAFEAITISWAYIDSLLHLNKVKIPNNLLEYFTVEANYTG